MSYSQESETSPANYKDYLIVITNPLAAAVENGYIYNSTALIASYYAIMSYTVSLYYFYIAVQ